MSFLTSAFTSISNFLSSEKNKKLEREKEQYKARCDAQEEYQAKMDAQRAHHDEMLQKQMKQDRANAMERIRNIEAEKKEIIENYERATATRENATVAERMQMTADFNRQMKEKTVAMEEVRKGLEKKEEELRAEHVKERKELEAQVNAEKEKRLEEEKLHGEKMGEAHRDHMNDVKALGDQIITQERAMKDMAVGFVQAHHETVAMALCGLSNIEATKAVEQEAQNVIKSIDSMRQIVAAMWILKRKAVEEMRESLKQKKGFAFYRTSSNNAENVLKTLSDEQSKLDAVIRNAFILVEKDVYDRNRVMEAKTVLNRILGLNINLGEEISKVSDAMVTSSDSVSLQGIVDCLNALDQTINTFPSMVTQTNKECMQGERNKLLESENRVSNAIAASEKKSIPSIESP